MQTSASECTGGIEGPAQLGGGDGGRRVSQVLDLADIAAGGGQVLTAGSWRSRCWICQPRGEFARHGAASASAAAEEQVLDLPATRTSASHEGICQPRGGIYHHGGAGAGSASHEGICQPREASATTEEQVLDMSATGQVLCRKCWTDTQRPASSPKCAISSDCGHGLHLYGYVARYIQRRLSTQSGTT